MLVTLFILINGWLLYTLLKPSEETKSNNNKETTYSPIQLETASLEHKSGPKEIEALSIKQEAKQND